MDIKQKLKEMLDDSNSHKENFMKKFLTDDDVDGGQEDQIE